MFPQEAWNFRVLGHDPSAAWGRGSLVEIVAGHAYVGGVGGRDPGVFEGFTVHDVRDPRHPHKVFEFKAPPGIHMHKLRHAGENILYVNADRLPGEAGRVARPGFFIFDISHPAQPRQIGFFDMPGSGPHRFGVDLDRKLALLPNDAEGWNRRVIWTLDIRDPIRPEVVGIWGLPWQKMEGGAPGNDPVPADTVCTLHGPPIIRGNRMFAAFWGGGVAVIDCSDLARMQLVGHVSWSPPFVGATHTACPIGDRPYLVVTDEARARQVYRDSQFMWVLDIRDETRPVPVSTWFPERDKYAGRGGRFGAHNIIERITASGPWANIVFLTYFNAGLRAIDVSDPLRPVEVGHFVPASTSAQSIVQSNDVGTDAEGRIYLIDRNGGGMHILEYTG
ncbi:hypothetical protein FHS55_000030 [Angulomicrobium tetraedrale]|uniref:Uncharacterized protein n=1 Tax=Ancylobacter tetraedralis TaxID=217068 RepID=A0A839YY33_9HYPH|nr:hypothetical protein [Ancylobacter tetraedralis]MBB3769444.1 hypothetical protein [Ancylobacter tetraedralis]